jgi:hypothetical protein
VPKNWIHVCIQVFRRIYEVTRLFSVSVRSKVQQVPTRVAPEGHPIFSVRRAPHGSVTIVRVMMFKSSDDG